MQLSLVYHTTKSCLSYNQVLFIMQPSLVSNAATFPPTPPITVFIIPQPEIADQPETNSRPVYKDTTFHHPFASFPPTFSAPPCLRCTSGVLPSRSTPDEKPHNSLIPNPKQHHDSPKVYLCTFYRKSFTGQQ